MIVDLVQERLRTPEGTEKVAGYVIQFLRDEVARGGLNEKDPRCVATDLVLLRLGTFGLRHDEKYRRLYEQIAELRDNAVAKYAEAHRVGCSHLRTPSGLCVTCGDTT